MLKKIFYFLVIALSLVTNAFALETFNMYVLGGPMTSQSSQNYTAKTGAIAGVIFNFSAGYAGWEIELLGAKRNYSELNGTKIDVIHGQLGAIMRYYVPPSKIISFGVGPYIAKPISNKGSIQSDQLEVGGAISTRLDTDAIFKFGPFATGLAVELRFTGGALVSGQRKGNYLDAEAIAGLRFGVL
ncbi:MAG: hypothetical protein AABZ06_03210 [Bdellovibrionota bacterium]